MSETSCTACPRRETCTEICPEIEKQLPGVRSGTLRAERGVGLLHGGDEDLRPQIIDSVRKWLDEKKKSEKNKKVLEILELYYWQGLTQYEIAEMFGISRQYVSKLVAFCCTSERT